MLLTKEEILKTEAFRFLIKRTSKRKHTARANKYPQGYFKAKVCRVPSCDIVFTPKAPSEHYCSDDCAHLGFTEQYLKRTYGLTFDQYIDLYLSQGGKCAICKVHGFYEEPYTRLKLCVDHNHETGKVRGMLCTCCNTAIGSFKEDISILEKAIEYLKE